jgi:hypothetical protein
MENKQPLNFLDSAFAVAQQNGWKLSILIDNPLPEHIGEGHESYVGKVFGFDENFVALDLTHNSRLNKIIIRKSLILSIWIYRE